MIDRGLAVFLPERYFGSQMMNARHVVGVALNSHLFSTLSGENVT